MSIEKLEYIHCAIQEAMNGNNDMLFQALECVEYIREDDVPLVSWETMAGLLNGTLSND